MRFKFQTIFNFKYYLYIFSLIKLLICSSPVLWKRESYQFYFFLFIQAANTDICNPNAFSIDFRLYSISHFLNRKNIRRLFLTLLNFQRAKYIYESFHYNNKGRYHRHH